MTMQTLTLFRIRWYLPAPKFCPTKVVMEIANALITIQKRASIFPRVPHAATVSVPRLFTNTCITILEILYITDSRPAGIPILRTENSILLSKRIWLIFSTYISLVFRSITVTISALITWEVTVATATPVTPMPNATTNSRSRIMFSTQVMIRTYSGLLESPTARRMAAPIL